MRMSSEMLLGKYGKPAGLNHLFMQSRRLLLEAEGLNQIFKSEKEREAIRRKLIVSRISKDLCSRLLCLISRRQSELINMEQTLLRKVESGLELQRQELAMKRIKRRSPEEFYKHET